MARLVFLTAAVSSWVAGGAGAAPPVVSSLEDLSYDENGHLDSHWLLLPVGCSESPKGLKIPEGFPFYRFGQADGKLAHALSLEADACPAAASVELGTAKEHVVYNAQHFSKESSTNFAAWFNEQTQVEVGWVSYHTQRLKVVWVAPDGGEHLQGELRYGEQGTHWRTVYLGHHFRVIDVASSEVVLDMVASKTELKVLGEPQPLREKDKTRDRSREISRTDSFERKRAKAVHRTFTEHGYGKVQVPPEIWASMRTYYYNNRGNMAREEWNGKGVYVNWWEVDPLIVAPPFGLKLRWHNALRPMAEEWIGGYELENTDLYGMRQYNHGAKLLKHVDRQETHAVSMIINIDQSDDLEEPWLLEIHDHQTETPQFVDMKPGDMVFYESARCMHGRPEPLKGSFYVNLFTHYRPSGNPSWYREDKATAVLDGKVLPLEQVLKQKGSGQSEGSEEIPFKLIHKTAKEASFKLNRAKQVVPDAKKAASRISRQARRSATTGSKSQHRDSGLDSGTISNPFTLFMVLHPTMATVVLLLLGSFVLVGVCVGVASFRFTRKQGKHPTKKSVQGANRSNATDFGSWDVRTAIQASAGLEASVRHACITGDIAAVRAWTTRVAGTGGAESLDVCDANDRTGLHLAAKAGHDHIVRHLCEQGANPSALDKKHMTPLHHAAAEGSGVVVKLLIDYGANVFVTDDNGTTALHLAKAAGKVGCSKLLEREEAKGGGISTDGVKDLVKEMV